MFKPADIIIYLIIAVLILLPFLKAGNDEGRITGIKVTTSVSVHHFPADADSVYILNQDGADISIEVRDGKVRVLHSACPSKICVQKGWLEKGRNDRIVCMPQKVVVSYEGDKRGIDAVSE